MPHTGQRPGGKAASLAGGDMVDYLLSSINATAGEGTDSALRPGPPALQPQLSLETVEDKRRRRRNARAALFLRPEGPQKAADEHSVQPESSSPRGASFPTLPRITDRRGSVTEDAPQLSAPLISALASRRTSVDSPSAPLGPASHRKASRLINAVAFAVSDREEGGDQESDVAIIAAKRHSTGGSLQPNPRGPIIGGTSVGFGVAQTTQLPSLTGGSSRLRQ